MRVRRVAGAGPCVQGREGAVRLNLIADSWGTTRQRVVHRPKYLLASRRVAGQVNRRRCVCIQLRWTLAGCAPMVTSVWPLPRPDKVDRNGFWPTWLDLRLPLGVPPSVFCVRQ